MRKDRAQAAAVQATHANVDTKQRADCSSLRDAVSIIFTRLHIAEPAKSQRLNSPKSLLTRRFGRFRCRIGVGLTLGVAAFFLRDTNDSR